MRSSSSIRSRSASSRLRSVMSEQGAVEPDDAAVAAADRLPGVADPRLLAVRAEDAIGEPVGALALHRGAHLLDDPGAIVGVDEAREALPVVLDQAAGRVARDLLDSALTNSTVRSASRARR